jgi:cytoskeletal protein CcmA (bactofilin family)
MSTASVRIPTPQPAVGGAAATIGSNVRIEGKIIADQDLVIDGQMAGTIEAPGHKLTIGPNGQVKAAIKAKDVMVVGNVEGNIAATERCELGPQSRVLGDIKTARILVQDGAYFKGGIDIVRSGQS